MGCELFVLFDCLMLCIACHEYGWSMKKKSAYIEVFVMKTFETILLRCLHVSPRLIPIVCHDL